MQKFLKYFAIILLIISVSCLLFYRFWFLRLPQRNIVENSANYISPANGTVVSIHHFNEDSFKIEKEKFGFVNMWTTDVDTSGYIISIQMNVTNVHYQRAPKAGKIIATKAVAGSFKNALIDDNDFGIRFQNEHNTILFEDNNKHRYKIVQIAGFLARRIEDFVNPGQTINQGDVVGLIKLGSQVTVILPNDVVIKTKVGETVIDGETILATDKQ